MKCQFYIVILSIKFSCLFSQDFKQIQKQLESISKEDQKYRSQSDSIRTQFGSESKQYKELWKNQHEQDSINKITVLNIIDKYGWLSNSEIGSEGGYTLFSVIMHSDINTQEKYISLIRKAAKEGKANGSNLAMLEDRIALKKGKKQLYGTQLRQDENTKEYYFAPIKDPKNIDKRRKELGMCPLAEDYNTKHYQIIWDPKTYRSRE